MPARKRILVAPLDWGLGHATRCIPIINEITALGHEAVIAADGRAYDLLREEFPGLKFLRLKGYHPVYPENGNMVFSMAWMAEERTGIVCWIKAIWLSLNSLMRSGLQGIC